MTIADHQLRDLWTTPALMPDARTIVFKSNLSAEKHPVSSAVGRRFLCVASADVINIYPTDGTSSALPHSVAPTNKKGSMAVHGTRVQAPVLSIPSDQDILAISLSDNDRFLFAIRTGSVVWYDLAAHAVEANVIVTDSIRSGCVVNFSGISGALIFASGVGKKKSRASYIFFSTGDNGMNFSAEKPLPVNISDFCVMSSRSQFAAVATGNDEISLFEFTSQGDPALVGRCSVSPQCGDIKQVFPLVTGSVPGSPALGPDATGIVVHQHEAVSIFTMNQERELDLLFQFRDAISKQIYTSADLLNQYVIMLSCELFSKRYRVELFDLSLLKVKAVSLPPIRRWDVSRLVAASDNEEVVKVMLMKGPLLQFLMTGATDALGASSTAILWEPVVRDQWFSVMPNFAVLNKNEPYVETEEEFDFNQTSDFSTIQASINRYRTTDRIRFNFLPADQIMEHPTTTSETELMDVSSSRTDEVFFPFLQPLSMWKLSEGEYYRNPPSGDHYKCQFFSGGCRQLLAERIGKRI